MIVSVPEVLMVVTYTLLPPVDACRLMLEPLTVFSIIIGCAEVPMLPLTEVSAMASLLIAGPVIDWVIVPVPPALSVTGTVRPSVINAPREMFPLLPAPAAVVSRSMVVAVTGADTMIPAVVGPELPPFVLT